MNTTFGETLRRLRKQADMTQEELANKCNMKKQSISRYETGEREPNIRTAKIIADALGVKLESLVPLDHPYLVDEVETHDENGGSAGPQVTITLDDKDPDIAEMLALLDDFKNRADIRKLFEIAHNSTPEEVQQAAKIMEALRKE